jgi:hypothetical protein
MKSVPAPSSNNNFVEKIHCNGIDFVLNILCARYQSYIYTAFINPNRGTGDASVVLYHEDEMASGVSTYYGDVKFP